MGDPRAKSTDGCTALLYAVEYLENLDLACGATPRQTASGKSVVALLLAARVDVAAAADHGKTPLQIAEAAGDSSLIAIFLGKHTGSCHDGLEGSCTAASGPWAFFVH